jgi:4-hydroxy-2-oxoheptanedioate aldolase
MATHLQTVWGEGKTAIGAWITGREPLLAEVAATAGYDYVCIDMQHGLMSHDHVVTMLASMARTPMTPLVRVAWNEPSEIGKVLDAGAMGVIVPMVNSADDARAAVDSCFYYPKGSRSMGPAGLAGRVNREQYFATANESILCIPMIETREAVNNLDEILGVPGISALYVGPADLSITYGLEPKQDQTDQAWNAGLQRVVEACTAHGVVPGVHASAELAYKRFATGYRMITVGFDMSSAIAALRSDHATTRSQLDLR